MTAPQLASKSPRRPRALTLVCLSAALTAPGAATAPAVSVFTGMCDASAVVMVDHDRFIAANDEDNVLRVYRRLAAGPPMAEFDLGPFLGLGDSKEEADIEGAAALGSRVYWIASHGANKNGKERLARRRLFATDLSDADTALRLRPVGRPFEGLLEALLRDPRMAPLHLRDAIVRAPKEPGALNIEGLCDTADGALLLGLRNPVPEGRAWLIPLLNPHEVIDNRPARFGDPLSLDLGGLGFRGIDRWNNRFFIVAGPIDGQGTSRLYVWDGPGSPPEPLELWDWRDLNPEAIAAYAEDGAAMAWIVSDDGSRAIGSDDCKRVKDPWRRQFRAQSISLDFYLNAHRSRAGTAGLGTQVPLHALQP